LDHRVCPIGQGIPSSLPRTFSLGSVVPILQLERVAELVASSAIQRIPQATAHCLGAETVGALMYSALELEHAPAEETLKFSFLGCFQEWDCHIDWVVDEACCLRDWGADTAAGVEKRLAEPTEQTVNDPVGLLSLHRKRGFRMEMVFSEELCMQVAEAPS